MYSAKLAPPAWLAAVAIAIAACTTPIHATTYTVTSEADVPEDTPGDGSCDPVLALPGVCTLRAAVMEANAHAGSDTILLTADQTYTLTRSGLDASGYDGDLDIHDDVNIIFFASGERPIVDAGGLERAFEIHEGSVLMLGFDITGGNASVPGDSVGGAIAINFDAGIVQLSLLRMYGNLATFGGALYNDGNSTTVTASEFYGNQIEEDVDGATGSAIYNRGTLTVDGASAFGNATATNNTYGYTTIVSTPPFGGEPSLTIINSTVALNNGGGVYAADDSFLLIRNSTIVANIGGVGVGNNAYFGMRNSVVALNDINDCNLSPVADLNLNRYNMDSDDTCELSSGSSNYPGVDPLLTPLARHGGFTHAVWPRTNSPVIDQGHPAISSIGCEDDDQHGTTRPVDFDASGTPRCDVGAIEMSDDVIFFDPFDRL